MDATGVQGCSFRQSILHRPVVPPKMASVLPSLINSLSASSEAVSCRHLSTSTCRWVKFHFISKPFLHKHKTCISASHFPCCFGMSSDRSGRGSLKTATWKAEVPVKAVKPWPPSSESPAPDIISREKQRFNKYLSGNNKLKKWKILKCNNWDIATFKASFQNSFSN